jgi:hypothetical protein
MQLENYIFNKITEDTTLQTLLNAGGGKYHIYPNVIPRDTTFSQAITFTKIITNDVYPAASSSNVQFNIFASTHVKITEVAQALSDLFNGDNNNSDDGFNVIFSIRKSESDLGYDFDEKLYQREATYYFKLR